ncbi:MAG: hypothetical protein AB8U25_03065 [Rickettsiales endosymbiont of Dermacentor nuttalli]
MHCKTLEYVIHIENSLFKIIVVYFSIVFFMLLSMSKELIKSIIGCFINSGMLLVFNRCVGSL